MTLRKNPLHPAHAAANQFDIDNGLTPASATPPGGAPAGFKATTQAAPIQPAAPAQVPAPAAPAPAAPAQTVLSAIEVAALQQRLGEQAAALESLRADQERQQSRYQSESDTQIASLRAELAARDTRLAELTAMEDQRALDALTRVDVSGLTTLDPEQANELSEKVLSPVIKRVREAFSAQVTELRKEAAASRKENADRLQQIDEEERAKFRRRVNAQLLEAVPDFQALNDTSSFAEYKARRIPHSTQTYGEAMAEAYRLGDVQYMVDRVKEFQRGRPDVSAVAEIDMSGTGGGVNESAQVPSNQPAFTYADYEQMGFEFRRGRVTKAQWQAFETKFREAEKAGRVS